MNNRDYAVLHGFNSSAGQPAALAHALRKIGINAANVAIGPNRFGYSSDFHFQGKQSEIIRDVLSNIAIKYDIIHIHAVTPFFEIGMPTFPMGTDLLALKLAGKKIVIHFRGSEIRIPSKFREMSPYHYVDDDTDGLIKRYHEAKQLAYLELCKTLADELIVSDPELRTYVPEARILPRAIDMSEWRHIGLADKAAPLVIHAPSRQGVKGTKHVLAAVEQLHSEGIAFEFRLIEGLPQNEARRLFEAADIIVDQLRIGWYGVLAVEGMALGKAVISYVRDDVVSTFKGMPPVYIANPDNIKERLRQLIVSRELRQQVAAAGHDFCRRTHDLDVVAQLCVEIYDSLEPKFDFQRYMRLNADQQSMRHQELLDAKARGASNAKKAIVAAKMVALAPGTSSPESEANPSVKKVANRSPSLYVRLNRLVKREGFVGAAKRVLVRLVGA